jgi:hypothetical protein
VENFGISGDSFLEEWFVSLQTEKGIIFSIKENCGLIWRKCWLSNFVDLRRGVTFKLKWGELTYTADFKITGSTSETFFSSNANTENSNFY